MNVSHETNYAEQKFESQRKLIYYSKGILLKLGNPELIDNELQRIT